MAREIRIDLDERCELGSRFWRATRGQELTVKVPTPCLVAEDCGAVITPEDRAAIWYFTRNSNNTTEVGVLCWSCDRDLVALSLEEEAL
jgi:hypothetical protein